MKRERGNKGGGAAARCSGGRAQSESGIGFHCRRATPLMFSRVASLTNNQHHVETDVWEEAETAFFFNFLSKEIISFRQKPQESVNFFCC